MRSILLLVGRLQYTARHTLCVVFLSVLATSSIVSMSRAEYPPAGSEIASLQSAYDLLADKDTIRVLSRVFPETLILDRSINFSLNCGFRDTSYTAISGLTRLNGSLVIKKGSLNVNKLIIGGRGEGIKISNVSVSVPRISWNTDNPGDSRVEYGETTSYGRSVNSAALTTNHELVLTGLKPNTTYHFIVSSSESGITTTSVDTTFTTPAFIAATTAEIGHCAVIEIAGNYDARNADGTLNFEARKVISQEYFKTHNDSIDFLVIFSTFNYAMPDPAVLGFYTSVKNDTLGINKTVFDSSLQYGSNSKLQGIIDMGNVAELAVHPYGSLLGQTLITLSHELAHRFGAYVRYMNIDMSPSMALLGKDNSHWSYLLDSQGSVMYGNGWKKDANGNFTTISKQNYYSPLDLYLMGIIPADEVPSMLLIENAAIDKTQLPQLGTTISGSAITVTIKDIIAAEGERVPDASSSPKQFSIGYVLLQKPGDSTGPAVHAVEAVRMGFAARFAELTRGRGSIAGIPASLEVHIDTPADGSIITGPGIRVAGAVINTTGAETGVTVNGIPATVSDGHFTANNISVTPDMNTITVNAIDINGLSSTTTKTVSVQKGHHINLNSNIESGLAPLDVALTVDGSFPIAESKYSYAGPVGPIELPGSTANFIMMRLPVEGDYELTAKALGPDGQTYSDTVQISVLSRSAMERLLKGKWEGLKQKISTGDVDGALTYVPKAARERFQALIDDPSLDLPTRLNEISGIKIYTIKDGTAQGGAIRHEVDGVYAYPLNFIRDRYGIWRIRGF